MESRSPFVENNINTWFSTLALEVRNGQHTLEEVLPMLQEKPRVFILALMLITERKLQYTQEIHEKIIKAMERYEQRTDIKELIYKKTETLLKNGKA